MGRLASIWVVMAVACGGGGQRLREPSPPPSLPPPAPAEAAPILDIDPGVLHALMIAGELRVMPDEATIAAMRANRHPMITVTVSVCLDVDGALTTRVVRPGRYPAYERAVGAIVAGWRFRPYQRDGVAMEACSVANFQYMDEAEFRPAEGMKPPDLAALPEAAVELPASKVERGALPPGSMRNPAAPGVALVRLCRQPGTLDAPTATLLQSSGDDSLDRRLLDAPTTAPVGEAPGPVVCALRTGIAAPTEPELEPTPDPPATAPRTVLPVALEQVRISGDRMIFPSDLVKTEIHASGKREILVPVKMCLDRAGRVSSVRPLRSSGHIAYDADLINGIAVWRYRPFQVDGKAAPVCSVILFIYRQKG